VESRFDDPTAEDWRAVAAFAKPLADPTLVVGVARGGERDPKTGSISWPWVEYSDVVQQWMTSLYDHNIVMEYGEPGWDDKMDAFVAAPCLLDLADLTTIRKVLTTIVRRERFCDGAIMSAFDCGIVQAAMLRLAELAAQADGGVRNDRS
jgi:hypothetical protein